MTRLRPPHCHHHSCLDFSGLQSDVIHHITALGENVYLTQLDCQTLSSVLSLVHALYIVLLPTAAASRV